MTTMHEASCECGFTTRNAHRSYVDRALRVHSCEKWREKLAGQQRRAARMASIDRTPQPCHHKQANHQHGTRACYVLDRCRCTPCSTANAAAENDRERQKAYGRYDKYVDATEAREHLRALAEAGMGLKRVTEVSGIAQGLLWKLVYGKKKPDGSQTPTKRVLRTTHDRIMAVQLDLADGALVDPTGTTRRIRALVALGWSQSKLAERLGIARCNFFLAAGDRGVTVRTAKAVVELFDELSMTLPPQDEWRDRIAASRARNYAEARGWLPPLALDEDRLDDPTYEPGSIAGDPGAGGIEVDDVDQVVVERRLDGDKTVQLNRAERFEVVRRARAAGWSYLDIERRAGIPKPERYINPDTEAAAS